MSAARSIVAFALALAGCTFAPRPFASDAGGGGEGMGGEGPPADAWLDPWMHRKAITLHASQIEAPGDGALADFPVLVMTTDAELAAGAAPGGADLAFTGDDAMTRLEHEIESYEADQLVAWVKVPNLSSTVDTTIYVYYGNSGAQPAPQPEAVWTAGYFGVYHMNQDPGPDPIDDSTANDRDGAPESSMNTSDSVGGQIGRALDFDGTNDFIEFTTAADFGDNFTISAWVNMPAASEIRSLLSNSPNGSTTDGFRFFINSNGSSDRSVTFETGNGGSTGDAIAPDGIVPVSMWTQVVAIVERQAGLATIIVGGEIANESNRSIRNDFNTASDFEVGRMETNNQYIGMLDELEVSSVARPLEWVRTTFQNQGAPGTFATLGPEQSKP